LAAVYVVPAIPAQIFEGRQYHGHNVTCVHSGIVQTNGTDCGTQNYARVFTGTVKSAFEIGETDKLLQLIPEEVFVGDPVSEVLAVTNQACLLREIRAGEKWLFYVYRNTKTNGLVLPYDMTAQVNQSQMRKMTLQGCGTYRNSAILAFSPEPSHAL
jgi:hypothetical protein